MRTYAATDLQKNIADIFAATNQAPVMITRPDEERYVLMTAKDYDRYVVKDPRRVYSASEAPDEHVAMITQFLTERKGQQ